MGQVLPLGNHRKDRQTKIGFISPDEVRRINHPIVNQRVYFTGPRSGEFSFQVLGILGHQGGSDLGHNKGRVSAMAYSTFRLNPTWVF